MAKVRVQYKRPPGTATATFKLGLIEARAAMLRHWHTTYVPGHFQLRANQQYGYQPRSGDNEGPRVAVMVLGNDGRVRESWRANQHYSWRKRRIKRHNRPNVWSGDSERIATSPSAFEVRTVSGDRTRGVFVGMPSYWYKYQKAGVYFRRQMLDVNGGRTKRVVVNQQQPNKADELTRITNAEAADLHRVGQARVVSYLHQFRAPTRGVA